MITKRLYNLVIMAIFVALAIALGLALIYIPNVELVTATFFLAGYFLGCGRGIIVAILGEFLYSLLNPYGVAAPPLLVAQIVSMTLVGMSGGLFRQFQLRTHLPKWQQHLLSGLLGLLLTFVFDLLTTVSFLVFAGLNLQKFLVSVIYGLSFYILHMVSNTLIFFLVIPLMIRALEKRIPNLQSHVLLLLLVVNLLVTCVPNYALASLNTPQTIPEILVPSSSGKDSTSFYLSDGILNCQDFVYLNHSGLAELLKFFPGLWLRNSGGFGQPIWLQMQGLPLNQGGIFLEGLPLENPILGFVDLNLIPVEWIKQIEYRSSITMSLPVGTWPLIGIINLATKATSPQLPKPYSKVTYRTGSFDFSDVNVLFARSFGKIRLPKSPKSKTDTSKTNLRTRVSPVSATESFWPIGRKDLLLGAEIMGTNGRFVNSRYDGQKIYTRMEYFPVKNVQLIYQLLFNRVEAGFPGEISSSGQSVKYPNLHRKQRRYDHFLTLLWQTSPHLKQLWHINATLYLEEWTDWSQPLHFRQRFTSPGASYLGKFSTQRHQISWNASLAYLNIFGKDGLWHTEKPIVFSLSDQLNLNKKFSLGGTLRYNYLKSTLHGASLQLFVLGKMNNKHYWRLVVARSTLLPTLGQLHHILPAFVPTGIGAETIYGTNDSLQIKSKPLRTGLLQSLHLEYRFLLPPGIQFLAEIFHHTLFDFPQWQVQDFSTLVAENGNKTSTLGASFSFRGTLPSKLNWCLVYDYLDAHNAQIPQIQELPNHYLRGWVRYHQRFFQGDLSINFILSGEWLSERSSQKIADNDSQWRDSGVSILNAKLVLDFGQAKIFYEIDNILNTDYQLIPFYPMPGKTVRYGIAWEFFD